MSQILSQETKVSPENWLAMFFDPEKGSSSLEKEKLLFFGSLHKFGNSLEKNTETSLLKVKASGKNQS